MVLGLILAVALGFHPVSAGRASARHACGAAVFNDAHASSFGLTPSSACQQAAARWAAGGNFAFDAAIVGYVLVRFRPRHRKWWHVARLPMLVGVAVLGAWAGAAAALLISPSLPASAIIAGAVVGAAAAVLIPFRLGRAGMPAGSVPEVPASPAAMPEPSVADGPPLDE